MKRTTIAAYNAVVFDFDGTLAFTREDVWDSVEYAAKAVGGALPAAFRADPRNLALPAHEIFHAVKGWSASDERFDAFTLALRKHYRELNDFSRTVLYPGIEALLQRLLGAGIPAYIVTAKPQEPLHKILRVKGWARLFRACFSPDSFGGNDRSKTELLRSMLDSHLSGLAAVYIGDSPGDVIAARSNGIPVIGVLYGDGDVERLRSESPDFVASTADEIAKLLFPDSSAATRDKRPT